MLWLLVEEIKYYEEKYRNDFLEKYEKKKIIIFPELEDIKENISEDVLFMAPFEVYDKYKNFIPQIRINTQEGALTSQEKKIGISSASALEKRLNITVVDSKLKLSDVGGAFGIKKWTKEYIQAEKDGYKVKAIMLTGIPGTGKTFFAKCFAGETNRKLVFLNLSDVLTKTEPIVELERIHTYLNNFQEEKFVILIDEIEKMIGNNSPEEKQLLGAFLTLLNEMNTPTSKYSFDVIYIATANNLNSIISHNPELLRRGRFDELFFINLPTYESCVDLIKLYSKKFNLLEEIEEIGIDDIITLIENNYLEVNNQANLIPYTPSEIETMMKILDFKKRAYKKISIKIIEEVILDVIPILKSAGATIDMMVGQKELFKEI